MVDIGHPLGQRSALVNLAKEVVGCPSKLGGHQHACGKRSRHSGGIAGAAQVRCARERPPVLHKGRSLQDQADASGWNLFPPPSWVALQ